MYHISIANIGFFLSYQNFCLHVKTIFDILFILKINSFYHNLIFLFYERISKLTGEKYYKLAFARNKFIRECYELEIVKTVAELMALAARTAPKAAGQDFVELKIISGQDLVNLGKEMDQYGIETGKKNFDRDGKNVATAEAVLLLSLKNPRTAGMNCGACGYAKCSELEASEGPEFKGGICAWRVMDLGIALGSAVKTASILNVDNRVMYRVGVLARKLGLIEGDIVVGVPLSATGKSPYFDR